MRALIGVQEALSKHCQHDNPTLGQELRVDGFADRFGIVETDLARRLTA